MCLSKIDNSVKKYIEKEGGYFVGYKVVEKFNKKIYPLFWGTRLKTNEWINEKDHRNPNSESINFIQNSKGGSYKTGFHFYLKKGDAYKHADMFSVVRKIYFRKPVAFGWQNKVKVGVAQEIFICKGKV